MTATYNVMILPLAPHTILTSQQVLQDRELACLFTFVIRILILPSLHSIFTHNTLGCCIKCLHSTTLVYYMQALYILYYYIVVSQCCFFLCVVFEHVKLLLENSFQMLLPQKHISNFICLRLGWSESTKSSPDFSPFLSFPSAEKLQLTTQSQMRLSLFSGFNTVDRLRHKRSSVTKV